MKKRSGFKLKSSLKFGQKSAFKLRTYNSPNKQKSPVKQNAVADPNIANPKTKGEHSTPSDKTYEMLKEWLMTTKGFNQEDADHMIKDGAYTMKDVIKDMGMDKDVPAEPKGGKSEGAPGKQLKDKGKETGETQETWEPAYEGGDHSWKDLQKMSDKDIMKNWPDVGKHIIKDLHKKGYRKKKGEAGPLRQEGPIDKKNPDLQPSEMEGTWVYPGEDLHEKFYDLEDRIEFINEDIWSNQDGIATDQQKKDLKKLGMERDIIHKRLQNMKEESPNKQKKTYPKDYTKKDVKFLKEQREDVVRYEDLDKKGKAIWKKQGKPIPKKDKKPPLKQTKNKLKLDLSKPEDVAIKERMMEMFGTTDLDAIWEYNKKLTRSKKKTNKKKNLTKDGHPNLSYFQSDEEGPDLTKKLIPSKKAAPNKQTNPDTINQLRGTAPKPVIQKKKKKAKSKKGKDVSSPTKQINPDKYRNMSNEELNKINIHDLGKDNFRGTAAEYVKKYGFTKDIMKHFVKELPKAVKRGVKKSMPKAIIKQVKDFSAPTKQTKSGKGNIFTKKGRNQRVVNKFNKLEDKQLKSNAKLNEYGTVRELNKFSRISKRKNKVEKKIHKKGLELTRNKKGKLDFKK